MGGTEESTKLLPSDEDYELQRLQQLCLPRWYDRIYSTVVRPERPQFAEILKDKKANPIWTAALSLLHRGIRNYSCSDLDRDHQEHHTEKCFTGGTGAGQTPMDVLFQDLMGFLDPDVQAKPTLMVIATILHDQECAGPPPPYLGLKTVEELLPQLPRTKRWRGCTEWLSKYEEICRGYKLLVEHMLLIDYGIGHFPVRESVENLPIFTEFSYYLTKFAQQCRDGHTPAPVEWDMLFRGIQALGFGWTELKFEIALALYYYCTHRQPVEQFVFDRGYTDYTGVMQEVIAEIPTRGADRLVRKLSVDVQVLIPQCCGREHKRELIAAANKLAQEHGLEIRAPSVKEIVEIPDFDVTHRDGCHKDRKRA